MQSVRLWHGATASRAEQIATEGFHKPDGTAMVVSVAREFSVDDEVVLRWLEDRGRFISIQERRDDSAWFAATHGAAVRWAQRAPEARWEALWAVWCIREDRPDEWCPWNDPKAAAWHLRQFFGDEPAVVELEVPVGRLRDNCQQPLPREKRNDYLELISDGLLAEVSVATPIPAEWVVGYTKVERRIGFTAAAGLFCRSTEELAAMVDREHLPSPRKPERPEMEDWYWTDNDLAQYRVL